MEEKLTIEEAYRAMFAYLEEYYNQTKSDDIGIILGELSLGIWTDGTPGDPAAWSDWLKAVSKVIAERKNL